MRSGTHSLLFWVPLLGLLILVGWRYRKPLLYFALTLTGRNHPKCSAIDVLTSPANRAVWGVAERAVERRIRLLERDPAGFELCETPLGRFWVPGDSRYLSHILAEQERQIYGSQRDPSVQPGDIVLDCGAHIGVFTKEALRRGAKLVVAIEPAPENLTCLRRNLATEISQGAVLVVAKGLFDREGRLAFRTVSHFSAGDHFVVNPAPAATTGLPQLPVTTIDRLVAELRLPRVDFIKMDIEGSERYAVAGAAHTLKTFKPRLALATYHGDDIDVIPAAVTRAHPGYRMKCGLCALDRARFRLRPAVVFFN